MIDAERAGVDGRRRPRLWCADASAARMMGVLRLPRLALVVPNTAAQGGGDAAGSARPGCRRLLNYPRINPHWCREYGVGEQKRLTTQKKKAHCGL